MSGRAAARTEGEGGGFRRRGGGAHRVPDLIEGRTARMSLQLAKERSQVEADRNPGQPAGDLRRRLMLHGQVGVDVPQAGPPPEAKTGVTAAPPPQRPRPGPAPGG